MEEDDDALVGRRRAEDDEIGFTRGNQGGQGEKNETKANTRCARHGAPALFTTGPQALAR
jgi:hypothetical protein